MTSLVHVFVSNNVLFLRCCTTTGLRLRFSGSTGVSLPVRLMSDCEQLQPELGWIVKHVLNLGKLENRVVRVNHSQLQALTRNLASMINIT